MKIERNNENDKIAVIDALWLKYALIATSVLFVLLYVWQVNISATHGYAMRDLEDEIAAIEHQNERLQYEVSRLRSVESVTTRVQMLGLTKISDVNYIKIGGDSEVAMGR